MGEPIRERWIAEAAGGKSFAEVGGLWGTVNEQVTVAAQAGATSTTMIDVAPEAPEEGGNLWERFQERANSLGVDDTNLVRGNIDDPETVARVGRYELVSCSGVLYHCPEPLRTLRNLRAITSGTLILGTASMPETIVNVAGQVAVEPGSALLVPAMTHAQRAILGHWLFELGDVQAIGLNYPIEGGWDPDDYSAWWWFFTRDYVAALLEVAGFEVLNVVSYWEGRATLYLARAVDVPGAQVG